MAAFLQRFFNGGSLLTSPTLWTNLIAGAIALAGHLSGLVPPEYAPWVALVIAGLNVALRVIKALNPQPPGPDVPVDPNHPAAPLADLLKRVFDALLKFQITAEEATDILTPAITKAAAEAEKAAPDVLGGLKAEAAK